MSTATIADSAKARLRAQAVSRLASGSEHLISTATPVAALQVLYQLASSPETAPRALTLLHELQVHQVELDLQDDELRRSRGELESALRRQTELYDLSPAACFTVDADTAIYELNLAGARLLGLDRDRVAGNTLAPFLTAESSRDLRAAFAKLGEATPSVTCGCRFKDQAGAPVKMSLSVAKDADGRHFLVAVTADAV